MTYNFENVAIRCDTWQQMERLAEIAEKQGYKVLYLNRKYFWDGCNLFRKNTIHPFYSNYPNIYEAPIIPFATFINSHPDYRVEGC